MFAAETLLAEVSMQNASDLPVEVYRIQTDWDIKCVCPNLRRQHKKHRNTASRAQAGIFHLLAISSATLLLISPPSSNHYEDCLQNYYCTRKMTSFTSFASDLSATFQSPAPERHHPKRAPPRSSAESPGEIVETKRLLQLF